MSEYEVFDKVRLVNDIFFFENNLYDETLIDRQIKLCGLDTTHYKVYNSLSDCFDMLECLRGSR